MLRRPAFQDELSSFLRKYPVFFCFRRAKHFSDGSAGKKILKKWKKLLRGGSVRFEQVQESSRAIFYRASLNSVRQLVELEDWERSVGELEFQQLSATHEANDEATEWQVFSRVPPLIDTIPGIQGDKPNPQYLELAGCTEMEFVRDSQKFEARWNNFPHQLSPSREPIILLRNAILGLPSNIQLFIPVSALTTKVKVEKRWKEVVFMQRFVYKKKKRPNRKPFENLFRVYDLRQKFTTAQVAKKLGMSRSSVEKSYRQIHLDVHGVSPRQEWEQSRPLVQGRRKTRLNFPTIAAMRGARESEDEVLRRALELGFPLAKLEAPEKLTNDQRKQLKDLLRSQNQERNDKVSFPSSFKRKNSPSR